MTLTRVTSLLLAVVLASTIGALVLPFLAHLSRTVVRVSNLMPLTGQAFVGTLSNPQLSDHDSPTRAQAYHVEVKPGTRLHNLAWCDRSSACRYFSALLDANFPYATHKTRTALGPGGAPHTEIAELGSGRFSVWRGYLYFSLPQSSSLADIGTIEIVPPSVVRCMIEALAKALEWTRDASAVLLCIYLVVPLLLRVFQWADRNLVQSLVITAAMVAATASGEFSATTPTLAQTTEQGQLSHRSDADQGQVLKN
jgi:hypothetical protein